MVLGLLKIFFKPSPIDKAFKHCLEADYDLMVQMMTFYESYKAVGIELKPDTSSFDGLEKILRSYDIDNKELTLNAVAAFIGCVVRELLGGTWMKTEDGKYRITGIGRKKVTIDLINDIRLLLENKKHPNVGELYCEIAALSQ